MQSNEINNQIIKPTDEDVRYLGYIINAEIKSNAHLSIRKKNCLKRYFSLNPLGLNNEYMDGLIKAFLIKTYCQPILYYGIENLNINKIQLQELSTTVGHMLKKIFHLNKRTRNSDILNACNMHNTLVNITIRKLKFLFRLHSNNITNIMTTF